ncbi:ribonuclease T2 family protein [Agrobacterium cavarae]|uniref:ribonuclease T2 family protein n=1 Tax=Agrobacterium cavarae TaxID=2528239 RepID=UPI00406D0AD8
MKQYFGFIALGALSLAAAGWVFLGQPQPASGPTAPRTGTPSAPSAQDTAKTSETGFDFYVLSLSWSPAFCASDAGRNSRQQCGADRKFGFVVHGLWPQNDQGYPEFCGADKNERVPDNLGRHHALHGADRPPVAQAWQLQWPDPETIFRQNT